MFLCPALLKKEEEDGFLSFFVYGKKVEEWGMDDNVKVGEKAFTRGDNGFSLSSII